MDTKIHLVDRSGASKIHQNISATVPKKLAAKASEKRLCWETTFLLQRAIFRGYIGTVPSLLFWGDRLYEVKALAAELRQKVEFCFWKKAQGEDVDIGLHQIHLWNIWFKIYDNVYTPGNKRESHPSRHFWVDDFPWNPRWSGICDRSLEGTDNTNNTNTVDLFDS